MTKRILLIISLFGLVAVQAQSILLFEPASAHRLEAAQPQQLKATLSAEVTVRAAGRGNPWINLSDGRDLETNRTLSGASLLEEADPTGLATGDFNEDGSPDLVVGYMSDGGLGIIILHRGNIASVYPSSSDASLGASDSPFLDSPRLIELPDPAEFLAAGDFDADGHCDLIAAARDRSRMFLLRGDGKGGLGNAEPIELPGKITALTSGEINRPDGLTDIVVAISGADGPKVIVFEGPEGAARAAPEVLDLPSEARALALGRLDDDPLIDLAVGAGRELLIVNGRDRQLSIDRDQWAEVHPAIIHRQSLSFTVESLVLGDFSGDSRLEIALMSGDGRVRLFGRKEAIGGTALARPESARWRQISALAEVVDNSTGSASLLVRARLSSLPKDNLVVLDQSRLQMQIVAFDGVSRNRGVVPLASPKQPVMVSIDADEEPVAVLPMRLNADAISDLVVLRRGHRAPSLLITPAAFNFTVTSVADLPDASPGDGVCDIGTSICTLRAAIQEANASAGLDTISFSLGSGTPSIIVGGGGFGPLPLITEAVTIQGNSGGATRIELNGTVAGPAATGLSISSGGATVRGLVINRFAGGEILLTNNGGNTIEGCIIGANAGGTAGFPNPADGVSVSDSPGNTIGGASAAAGNIISANGLGVHIDGPLSTGNRVQGNFIGTTLLGNAALANATGVVVSGGAANNSVGGAVG
ncbi:MAG TPA: CSLREA domain-containing protein, partial [Blastocatellia bacterium]|nr:CSLREA domain-containing protein [Blastocatellia bacterium]